MGGGWGGEGWGGEGWGCEGRRAWRWDVNRDAHTRWPAGRGGDQPGSKAAVRVTAHAMKVPITGAIAQRPVAWGGGGCAVRGKGCEGVRGKGCEVRGAG